MAWDFSVIWCHRVAAHRSLFGMDSMNRPLHAGIARILSKPRHRILIFGKASTLSAQLKAIADRELGIVPWQDVDCHSEFYDPNISREAKP